MRYFGEREQEEGLRDQEALPEFVWRGIQAEIFARIKNGSFGAKYPDTCPDGDGTIGTDESAFFDAMTAIVGQLEERPWVRGFKPASTAQVMEIIEFCFRVVGEPIPGCYHRFYGHHHITFDIEQGLVEFRDIINDIFRKNGLAYELTEDGEVQRLAPPVLREALVKCTFGTNDTKLEEMLEEARTKFLSPDVKVRREALERLWDAFERLKTIEPGAGKKAQAAALLDKAAGTSNPKLRDALEEEARSLTDIGNTFQIRHSETHQEPLTSSRQVDYLFHRLFAFVVLLVDAIKPL